MTREEAQNILQVCRPGNNEDFNDPLIAEAMALLEKDSELKAWFEAEQAFDTQMAAELEAIAPPADLKASLLAGMRAHSLQAEESSTEAAVATTRAAWWRNPWIGIAALFVFMAVIMNQPSDPAANLRVAQASAVPGVLQFLSDRIDGLQPDSFDKRDAQFEALQSFLVSHGKPSPATKPPCFNKMQTIGCVTFDYGDTKLSMICFNNGSLYHLSTATKVNFPDELPDEPQTYQLKDKAFKLWIEGDQVRIITVHGTEEDIPEFI